MKKSIIEKLALALGYTAEEIASMAISCEQLEAIAEQLGKQAEQGAKILYDYMADELAELKREQREFGRSRLAQFGKTFPNRKRHIRPRPYWFRTRSFCVRSPYG